jgi:hypothetical protein
VGLGSGHHAVAITAVALMKPQVSTHPWLGRATLHYPWGQGRGILLRTEAHGSDVFVLGLRPCPAEGHRSGPIARSLLFDRLATRFVGPRPARVGRAHDPSEMSGSSNDLSNGAQPDLALYGPLGAIGQLRLGGLDRATGQDRGAEGREDRSRKE